MLNQIIISTLIISTILFSNSYADEPILITKSSGLDEMIFDGKWSDNLEWKMSSYDSIVFSDDSNIVLRSAHQNNFIYMQINVVTDHTLDKGSDSALVCFDTKNDKTTTSQKDDYCFFTTLNGKSSFTLQGGNSFAMNGHFSKIQNHEDYIAIGAVSDKNDRYSKTPHPSYEFKIPLEILSRSDNYGFYFSAFDASSHKTYSWPTSIEIKNSMTIPGPNQWGNIISPDKSLPELNLPIVIFTILIFTIILIQTKVKIRTL
jgi:hypothetical protein